LGWLDEPHAIKEKGEEMLESFALNGRVGDIGIKDKVIEVKLVFPNDERTQDELAFLFPIKKGLATVRILAAVNVGYTPGRRRADRDETGTPLLPGVVDMNEICHACGRTVDCVNEPFFAKPVKDGKEIILCDACYRVPQPEMIETAAAEKEEDKDPVCRCGHTKTDHAFDVGWMCKAPECTCEEFAVMDAGSAAEPPIPEPTPGTLLGHPIVEDPSLQSGEIVFGTVEQIGDPDLVTEVRSAAQLEKAADAILNGAPPAPKVCATCGHPHGERFVKEGGEKRIKRFWKMTERDDGTFEICPACGAENQFPEGGGK
jgi:hypothetical protein